MILYEVLTGKHPFIDDEEEPSFEEMLAGHLNAEPVPVHKLVPDCSSGLGDLVSKCIAKEPSARYATFAQVALAIRALLHALGPAIPANHPEARRRKQEEARSARQAAFEAMPLEEAEHVEAAGKVAQSVTAELRGFVPRESALPFAHQPSAVPEPAIVSQPASPPVVLRAVTEEPQNCTTRKLRQYDASLGGASTIKAEVPYDMSQTPPAPIMSKNHPGPTTGSPGGSQIPDVVVLYNGAKPPTQDNIKKVIEIKFPGDPEKRTQRDNYPIIAGSAPYQVWGPDDPCQCKGEEEPEPFSVEEIATITILALAVALMLVDDVLPGGQADDLLLPPVVAKLLEKIAPLLLRLRGAFPTPLPVSP